MSHEVTTTSEQQFALQQREAMALAVSSWTPQHLIGKTPQETQATCLGVVQMARKWDMAPSMVAGETYSVKGKIGFQGKLYAALANAHGGFGGLRVIYSGTGQQMAAVVFGAAHELTDADRAALKSLVKTGDSEAATDLELAGVKAVRLTVEACKTDNKMWRDDPQQKLFYTGSTKWCRRYMPELVLGAVSVEDMEAMDATVNGSVVTSARTTEAIEAALRQSPAATQRIEHAAESQPASSDGPTSEELVADQAAMRAQSGAERPVEPAADSVADTAPPSPPAPALESFPWGTELAKRLARCKTIDGVNAAGRDYAVTAAKFDGGADAVAVAVMRRQKELG